MIKIFDSRNAASSYLKRELNGRHYCYILYDGDKPFYVGKAFKHKRVMDHELEAINHRGSNLIKESKIRKILSSGGKIRYGIIGFFTNELEVNHAEISLIMFYGKLINSTGILTNILDGGEGSVGRPASQKQIEAIRAYMTGKFRSEETRQRLSASLKEYYRHNKSTFAGKKHSEKTRQIMSERVTGEKHHQYGKRGENCHNYGRKHSDSTKLKIKEALSNADLVRSDEFKSNLKQYWENQPRMVCPHCGKESSFKAAMVRHHFDNCKYNSEKVPKDTTHKEN